MTKSKLFALAPVAAAILIAGCGGSGSSTASTKTSSTKTSSTGATVALAHSKFGNILVDAKGRTLYLFAADKSTSSTCYGGCASLWPPLTVSGAPKAGAQIKGSLLGTTKRKDGKVEVTYGGHPLYYFVSDRKPGQTTGQGVNQFGGPWWVISAAGKEIHRG
jgi:predicted lipoprotein with Yx(FWY)xxD motif